MAATTYTKDHLSGSTDGKGIKVAGTSSGGADTIHTATTASTTTDFDEVWIWCVNTSASAVKLTIMWGGTGDPDDFIEYTVAPEDGLKCIIPGLVLQHSLAIKAFAGTTNLLVIHGFVNKMVTA